MQMSKAKLSLLTLRRKISAAQKRIAKERDDLIDLIDDAQQIEQDCDEAVEYLEHAVDKLSELQ
jgi:predicted  nucleic acid-binding Zn-ribbon protein